MVNTKIIAKLTALWAFAECSLGGIMHLFKLPFTGFFVGGFAILMIGLISYFSSQNFKIVMQATILVILVKAGVSPHSPPAAYFAVMFQGLIGATLFSIFSFNKITAWLFGAIAMIESSMQLIVSKTLFYGMDFWKALDLFFINIVNELGIDSAISFSNWFVIIYIFLYIVWGVILGNWLYNIPFQLSYKWNEIKYKLPNIKTGELPQNKFSFGKIKWIGIIGTLLFITLVLLANGEQLKNTTFLVFRSLLIIAFVFYVFNPIIKYLIGKYSHKKQEQIKLIVSQLPQYKHIAELAYSVASVNSIANKTNKYREFVMILIVLSLFYNE